MKNFKNLQRFKHLFEKHTIISTFRSVRGKKMYLEYVYRPVVHIFAIFPWTLYGRWRAVIISRPRNLRLAYTWLVKTLRLSCKSPKTENFCSIGNEKSISQMFSFPIYITIRTFKSAQPSVMCLFFHPSHFSISS